MTSRPWLAIGILLGSLAGSTTVHAQQRFLRHYSTEDGLAQSQVKAILQDRLGYLWLTTNGGVSRFDGQRFVSFTMADGLSHDVVRAMTEDPRGDLWFGTESGLTRYDGSSFEILTRADGLCGDRVEALAIGPQGNLWVGTRSGACRWDGRSFSTIAEVASGERVNAILADRHGNLWIASAAGVRKLDGTAAHFFPRNESFSGYVVSSLLEDREGRIWAATYSGGLWVLDGGSFRAERPTESLTIYRILEDRDGLFWFGTQHGVARYDGHRFDSWSDQEGLGAVNVRSVAEDREGNLWFGTEGAGVYQLPPTSFVRFSAEDGLGHDTVLSIERDRDGYLWFGTLAGATRYDGESFRTFNAQDGLTQGVVWDVFADSRGDLWFGTSKGVVRYDGRSFETFTIGETPNWNFGLTIAEDHQGRLWVGSYAGAARYDGSRWELFDLGFLQAPQVNSILIGDLGHLWFGTRSGAVEYDGSIFSRPQESEILSRRMIHTVVQDRAGDLWFGSGGWGVVKYSRSRGGPPVVETFTTADGLSNNSVLLLAFDERGDLWIGTNKGLDKLDVTKYEAGGEKVFRHYGYAEGFTGLECAQNAVAQFGDGTLWFGSVKGAFQYRPREDRRNTVEPRTMITGLRLFFEDFELPVGGGVPDAAGASRLTLAHDQNHLTFDFIGISLSAPEKVRYRHRLEGLDRDWSPASRSTSVTYSSLPPGDYTFGVKARNNDGVWNQQAAVIELTILPPPWKTWWAYTLYVLALSAVVTGYVRSQQNRLARERAIVELERADAERERAVSRRLREVDQLKDEFLANTSHELRTPLYGMTGLAESLIDGATGELPEESKANLSMIVASGRRLGRLINDILDHSRLTHHGLSLTRRPVDLHATADVVLTLAGPLVGSKELKLVNSIPPELPPADADEGRLEQILHNLVGNAVKFTESGKVEVAARVEQDRLLVTVEDTGIGIPQDQQDRIFDAFEQADSAANRSSVQRTVDSTGLGLTVTRQLVELHGGRIWVESTAGKGASFHFTLPISLEKVADAPFVPLRGNPRPAEQPISRLPEIESAAVKPPLGGDRPAKKAPFERVLVVDDEPVNLQIIANQLASEGYQVDLAENGQQALSLIEEQEFDLVMLDVMMPRMSGYEVCRALRRSHPVEELPVIFLTARTQVSDLVTGLAAGGNDYLAKPVAKDELLARVRTHLELLSIHRSQAEEVKVLRGLLPICSMCKKIRDDEGLWNQIELYIHAHSEASFTHGICPDCVEKAMSELPGPGGQIPSG